MLRRWETTVRQFRAGLPESRFNYNDQNQFRDYFDQYIEKSNYTVFVAQQWHAHISGTVRQQISGTKRLGRRLNDTLLPSTSTSRLLTNGPLAISMSWLSDRHLIYLPYGVEPFKLSPYHNYETSALELIKTYVSDMQNRVHIDIDLTTLLQTAMFELGSVSEGIEALAASIQTKNEDAAYTEAAALRGGI